MRPVCGYCFFIKECDILPGVLKPIEISGGGYENDTGRRRVVHHVDQFKGSGHRIATYTASAAAIFLFTVSDLGIPTRRRRIVAQRH
jgi:hypothetical protein